MDAGKINPELRKVMGRIPSLPFHNRLVLSILQPLSRVQKKRQTLFDVVITEKRLGTARVRIYRPAGELSGAGLLWIHGGGYILGTPVLNDRECALYARDLRMMVVSVGYRLAPQHPFPAAHDDCYTGWRWMLENAEALGIDGARIAIAGQSAGGGLAAGLVQRICDEGGIQPAGQALFCPMLDDRTAARAELDGVKHKMWNNRNNRGAWRFHLGQEPGSETPPPYASPGRREDLSGLPPSWIGVGDIDLFYKEDRDYAERLGAAGVPCQLDIYPGAPHGFEILVPDAAITRQCWRDNYAFLRRTLGL